MTFIFRVWDAIVRSITVVAGIFGVAMALYIPFVLWETYQVNQLCAEIKAGMKTKDLPELVEKYGFRRHWVERRGYLDRNGYQNIFVPTGSSVGDLGCEIVLDGDKVISAHARH